MHRGYALGVPNSGLPCAFITSAALHAGGSEVVKPALGLSLGVAWVSFGSCLYGRKWCVCAGQIIAWTAIANMA